MYSFAQIPWHSTEDPFSTFIQQFALLANVDYCNVDWLLAIVDLLLNVLHPKAMLLQYTLWWSFSFELGVIIDAMFP